MDREADFLDLFIEQREHAPHLELLVRAKVDRVLAKDKTLGADTVSRRLFDAVRNASARGTCTVELNRLSARVKASKQAPKSRRAARRAIAIKMVVGWRIQLMVRLGREVPELPSELLFSDGELRVLATFARPRELPPPERLGDAVGLVARLGGWLGRTRDPPGAQLMWHGHTQLVAMAFAFELRDEYG